MFYNTIQDQIDSIEEEEISYRNFHTNAYINSNGDIIKIPYKSILSEYREYFKDIIITAELTDPELYKYRYKPKLLSYDLYDTTELWSALLEINNMYSVIDFNLEKQPKIFHPEGLTEVLNEILILEGVLT